MEVIKFVEKAGTLRNQHLFFHKKHIIKDKQRTNLEAKLHIKILNLKPVDKFGRLLISNLLNTLQRQF